MAPGQPYKECPTCRAPAAIDAATCASCGHGFRTKFSPVTPNQTTAFNSVSASPPVQVVQSPSGYAATISTHCPACGSADITKVTGLVATQSQLGVSHGNFVAATYVGNGHVMPTAGSSSSVKASATFLAQVLSPPQPPAYPHHSIAGEVILWLAGAFIVLFGIGAMSSAESTAEKVVLGLIPGLLGLGCIGAALWIRFHPSQVQKRKDAVQAYHDKYARFQIAIDCWNRLYYCAKCDTVHDPATARVVPSKDVPYLF